MCYSRESFERLLNLSEYNNGLTDSNKQSINKNFLILFDLAKSKEPPKNICINPSFLIYKLRNLEKSVDSSDLPIIIRFHKKYESQLKYLFDELGWLY
jgi:hypothetical protein